MRARDRARAQRLIGNVAAPLRGLEAPGVALRLKRSSLRALDEMRDPLLWPSELGITELTALLGWPIGPKDIDLPGVPSPHPRQLPVAAPVPRAGRILGDSTLDGDRPVGQGVEEAKRVMHVIGPMGTGKSTMLVNLALADATAGRSVVLIDGKGDACTDFLERVDPKRHDDIVVFDPTDSCPVGVSVFVDDQPERSADVVFGVFKSLYGDQLGPRSSDLLHAALLTLARVGGCSLSMLPMILSNAAVRRPLVTKVAGSDPLGLGAFWAHFEALSEAERTHVIAPLRNKLDPILTLRPSLRAMFGQSRPLFSLRDLFLEPDKRPIVVISLGSAELGPEGARLMGSILLALIWQAAQERTRLPQSQRHPAMLYLDEFQEIVRLGDLADALGRARGLGVAFAALAHQSLTQLSPSMRQAVIAHARSRVCFQLSPQDAKDIAATTNGVLTPRDLQELPAFVAQASLLVSGDRMPWCTIHTRQLPPKIQSAAQVRAMSRARYGRPLRDVEAELLAIGGWNGKATADESFGRSRRPGGGK
ncbi:type IV secretion system DNA-binding domain-containing protein [Rhodococcus zopfii]|uniref:type IV secretion system DNA-binding domain-containing protein n=1 Tax=Rhodococcus zopfii TaxID=43772 RepID=UPI00366467A6